MPTRMRLREQNTKTIMRHQSIGLLPTPHYNQEINIYSVSNYFKPALPLMCQASQNKFPFPAIVNHRLPPFHSASSKRLELNSHRGNQNTTQGYSAP